MNKKTIIILFLLVCLAGIFGVGIYKVNARMLSAEEIERAIVSAANKPEEQEALQRVLKVVEFNQAWDDSGTYDRVVATMHDAQAAINQAQTDEEKAKAKRALETAEKALEAADQIKKVAQNAYHVAFDAYSIAATSPEMANIDPLDYINIRIQAKYNANFIEERNYLGQAIQQATTAYNNAQAALAAETPAQAYEFYFKADIAGALVSDYARQISDVATQNRQLRYEAFGKILPPETPSGLAGPYQLEVPLPGLTETSDLGQYIRYLFIFGLSIVGILALIAMVVGGVLWVSSAGNPNRISTAKSIINGALTGLALLLCSYIILWLINPDLVKWNVKLETPQTQTPSTPSTP